MYFEKFLSDGYIWGSYGNKCTENWRIKHAKQYEEKYPERAKTILTTGKKWDGKRVWDCATLTREIAYGNNIKLPSGATSQWKSSIWDKKGTLDQMPKDAECHLFRMAADGTMPHTGYYLGDGTFIHAKGTAYGVLHEPISKYAWTHFATYNKEGSEHEPMQPYNAKVYAAKGSTVRVRAEPAGKELTTLKIGTDIVVIEETAGWSKIQGGGVTGWMQNAFIQKQAIDDVWRESVERRLAALEGVVNNAN